MKTDYQQLDRMILRNIILGRTTMSALESAAGVREAIGMQHDYMSMQLILRQRLESLRMSGQIQWENRAWHHIAEIPVVTYGNI